MGYLAALLAVGCLICCLTCRNDDIATCKASQVLHSYTRSTAANLGLDFGFGECKGTRYACSNARPSTSRIILHGVSYLSTRSTAILAEAADKNPSRYIAGLLATPCSNTQYMHCNVPYMWCPTVDAPLVQHTCSQAANTYCLPAEVLTARDPISTWCAGLER